MLIIGNYYDFYLLYKDITTKEMIKLILNTHKLQYNIFYFHFVCIVFQFSSMFIFFAQFQSQFKYYLIFGQFFPPKFHEMIKIQSSSNMELFKSYSISYQILIFYLTYLTFQQFPNCSIIYDTIKSI